MTARMSTLGVAIGLVVYAAAANDFFLAQIGAQSAILGLIALSTMLLGGWGGIVSLSQLTVAGVAGYTLALLGPSSISQSLGLSMWIAIPGALVVGVAFGVAVGFLAGLTRGIYTIMITLAIGVATYYLANQNYAIFNGFTGYSGLLPPAPFGVDLRAPLAFFAMSAGIAFAAWIAVASLRTTSFGKALIASRDQEVRLAAMGYGVTRTRLLAHALASILAAVGGILLVWLNGRISPGTISLGPMIDILVIAVIGGMARPAGAFIGAVIFVLLQTFAIDFVDPERFNLLIGFVFLFIVLISPDGVTGAFERLRRPRAAVVTD